MSEGLHPGAGVSGGTAVVPAPPGSDWARLHPLTPVLRGWKALGLVVDGVAVRACGGFDADWASTGVAYTLDLDSPEDQLALAELRVRVDEVAEVPKAVRVGATVGPAGD